MRRGILYLDTEDNQGIPLTRLSKADSVSQGNVATRFECDVIP